MKSAKHRKLKPFWTVISDPDDVFLSSTSKEAPRLLIVMAGNVMNQVFILADNASIEILLPAKTDKMLYIVYVILAAYYCWDLLYPKQYQLLG